VLGQLALRDDAAAMVHQVREHAELVARQLTAPSRSRGRRDRAHAPQRNSHAAVPLAPNQGAQPLSTSSILNGLAT
jgi:hypothetical protein